MKKENIYTRKVDRSGATKRSATSSVRKKSAVKPKGASVQRVLPLGNAWVVKADRAKEFTVVTALLRDAVKIATSLAKHEHALLIIHNKNGTIKREISFAVSA